MKLEAFNEAVLMEDNYTSIMFIKKIAEAILKNLDKQVAESPRTKKKLLKIIRNQRGVLKFFGFKFKRHDLGNIRFQEEYEWFYDYVTKHLRFNVFYGASRFKASYMPLLHMVEVNVNFGHAVLDPESGLPIQPAELLLRDDKLFQASQMRDALVHELRHAYQSVISGNKSFLRKDGTFIGQKRTMDPEADHIDYLKFKHEMDARFAQAVSSHEDKLRDSRGIHTFVDRVWREMAQGYGDKLGKQAEHKYRKKARNVAKKKIIDLYKQREERELGVAA